MHKPSDILASHNSFPHLARCSFRRRALTLRLCALQLQIGLRTLFRLFSALLLLTGRNTLLR
jgi:hypothetical protein